MNVPNLTETPWDLIDRYNEQFPDDPLGTLDMDPDREERDLVRHLNEAIEINTPIKEDDHGVYINPKELREGALW
ncbi:MAG: hypothetical protein K9M84_13470 [Spirochaetia bacterium]|nr:hypothetical protein [Spirochaetia bacterium]